MTGELSSFSNINLDYSLCTQQDDPGSRIDAWLGEWKGRASSRRTALYGGTVTDYDSSISYSKGPDGTLEQVRIGFRGFVLLYES